MKTGTIYLYAFPNGKCYVGQTWDFEKRCQQHKTDCKRGVHDNPIFQACYDKYGLPAPEVLYRGIETQAELDRLEALCFDRFGSHYKNGGCNIKEAGSRGRHSEETKAKMSKSATGVWHSENTKTKISDAHLKRVADGMHHLQGENNPCHQRIADGIHNLQDPEWHREHNTSAQRVADGTHHFFDFEITSKGRRYSAYVRRQNGKARRRELYRIYAVLLFTKSLCQIYRTRQLTREGFFDKDGFPDTSHTEQLDLF